MGWELSLLACIDYTVSCSLTLNLSSFVISAIIPIEKSVLKGEKVQRRTELISCADLTVVIKIHLSGNTLRI